jgi:hypothetical protein
VRSGLVVLAVLGLAIAALVDGVNGREVASQAAGPGGGASTTDQQAREEDPNQLHGPGVPTPGALPGTLVAAGDEDGCRLRVVPLASVSLGEAGAPTACRVWVAPDGKAAAVATGSLDDPLSRELALVQLAGSAEPIELGIAWGEPDWSPDGTRLAWCDPQVGTVVYEPANDLREEVGGCVPRFAADGALFTVGPGGLMRDGALAVDVGDLQQGFEERPGSGEAGILDYDVGPGGLVAVTAVRTRPDGREIALLLWRQGRLEASVPMPEDSAGAWAGGVLRFSPDGTKLALGARPGGGLDVVDLRLGGLVMNGVQQRGFAWSPDGSWLAVAGESEVEIYDAISAERVYSLPVDAADVDWAGS